MAFQWAVLVVTALGVVLSRLSPSVPEVREKFELAQKYYAAKDYDTGVQLFRELAETPNNAVLNVDTIRVSIDELRLPLRLAATYQVGNSDRNMGLELLERSRSALSEGDSAIAGQRKEEAFRALEDSKHHFARLVREERAPLNVRVMSQYQIIRADYAMEAYRAVIVDVHLLLDRFPGSKYEDTALYDMAWSHYNLGEYPEAIESFQRVLEVSRDVVRRDRALFQIAECSVLLGDQDPAVEWYQRLVDKYDFTKLSEKELEEMKALKIRGVVKETTRELVAKAQIRIGDVLAGQGKVEEAIEAYSSVPQRYSQEQLLVEQAYTRGARLILERRGLEAGIRAYQQAIEHVDRKEFKAAIQLQIARELFDAGRYREVIDAYHVYMKAYRDVARIIGFDMDKVLFKIAEAYRNRGTGLLKDDPEGAAEALEHSLTTYDALLDRYESTPLGPDARFGMAVSHHALGFMDKALALFSEVSGEYPNHPAAPSALLQAGRIRYTSGAYQASASTYRELIERYPDFEWMDRAYAELAMTYKAMGKMEETIAALRQVRRSASDWVKVRAEIGEILTSMGRYDEALEGLDEAIAAGDGEGEVGAELRYIKGKIAYSKKNYLQAVPDLTEALEHSSNEQLTVSARFMRGLAYYEIGKDHDAAGEKGEAVRTYERSAEDLKAVLRSSPTPKMRNIAYRTLGTAMIKLGRSEETIQTYSALIASVTAPEERAGFQLLLMELYYDQRRFEETNHVARSIVASSFEDTNEGGYFRKERAYSVLSGALLELKQYEESMAAAKEGLERYPDSGESAALAFTLGLAYYGSEEYGMAARSFEEYVRRFPGERNVLFGTYYAGQSYQILGEYEKAAGAFRRIVRKFPKSPQAPESLFLCGENLYNALQFEASQKTFEELLERYPNSAFADDALYSLAWVYLDLNQTDKGLEAMETLVARFPESPHASRAQYTIGDHYYSVKKYAQAQEVYRRVIRVYPESEEAAKAAQLIQELNEERASRLYDEAFLEFERRNYTLAVQKFQELVERFPDTYTALAALANMAVAWEHLGDRRRAKELYDKVIVRGAGDVAKAEVVRFAKLRLEHL